MRRDDGMGVESNSQYTDRGVSFPEVAEITFLIFNMAVINIF